MRLTPASWAVVVLLPLLHFTLHVGFGVGAWAPDLVTVGLLMAARQVRVGVAAGLGFALGLMEDALSILSFGANAMALTAVGILGARSRDLFIGESLAFLATYLALGTWLRAAIHWLLTVRGPREGAVQVLLVQGPTAAIYAAAIGTLLLLVTGAWSRSASR